MRDTFELFQRETHSIDIVAFDKLRNGLASSRGANCRTFGR